jgi:hypothetical protein
VDIPYPLSYTDHARRTWHPYAVEFESPDGVYSVHLYAVSAEHAHLQLEALKENGRISGHVIDVVHRHSPPRAA